MTMTAEKALPVYGEASFKPRVRAADDHCEVRTIEPGRWDAIFCDFRDVIHEQTACFNEVNWSADDLQFLAVERRGQLVGGAVVRVVRAPMDLARLSIIRWGPLWRPHAVPDDLDNLRGVYRSLIGYVRRKNSFLLVIPRSDPQYAIAEKNILAQLGFEALYQPESPERYFVNVDQSADEALAGFAQKWRYNLRKSQKQDLGFEIMEGEAGLARFMELYGQMLQRKRFFETSPIDTLEAVVRSPVQKLRPVFGIVTHEGAPVAGAALDVSSERAIYLYGATNGAGNRIRAGYFMQWEIVRRLCEDPVVRWYDLGGGTSPTCSLHQFKRGLTGKTGVISDIAPYFGIGATRTQTLFGKAAVQAQLAKYRVMRMAHGMSRASGS